MTPMYDCPAVGAAVVPARRVANAVTHSVLIRRLSYTVSLTGSGHVAPRLAAANELLPGIPEVCETCFRPCYSKVGLRMLGAE
jgi:hypothetical protein